MGCNSPLGSWVWVPEVAEEPAWAAQRALTLAQTTPPHEQAEAAFAAAVAPKAPLYSAQAAGRRSVRSGHVSAYASRPVPAPRSDRTGSCSRSCTGHAWLPEPPHPHLWLPLIHHEHVQREAIVRVERVRFPDVQPQVALRTAAGQPLSSSSRVAIQSSHSQQDHMMALRWDGSSPAPQKGG
jgi:hypothetical protein